MVLNFKNKRHLKVIMIAFFSIFTRTKKSSLLLSVAMPLLKHAVFVEYSNSKDALTRIKVKQCFECVFMFPYKLSHVSYIHSYTLEDL